MSVTPAPAKRSPDGFVAQRMFPDDGEHGPWLLAAMRENGDLYVERLTDDAVAAWPDLITSSSVPSRGTTDTAGDQS